MLLTWRTGYEMKNLGFHVYRDGDGQRTRVNPELIAGGALLAGPGIATAGHAYAWVDGLSSNARAVQYWLEDVDLSGKRTMNGPVIPEISLSLYPSGRRPRSSASFPGDSPKDKRASRLRTLQARLGKNQTSGHSPSQGEGGRGSSVLGPRSAEIVVPGVDTGSKTSTLSQGSLGLSDRPGTPITLPSGQSKNLPPQEVQWMLAGWPAIKLFIQEEGWYRVTQPELVAAGLGPGINPQNLQLYVDGQEQAIEVNVQQKGQFGPQDSIEFYGTGLDNPFTDTRVYWLVVGATPGNRVPQVGSLMVRRAQPVFPSRWSRSPGRFMWRPS